MYSQLNYTFLCFHSPHQWCALSYQRWNPYENISLLSKGDNIKLRICQSLFSTLLHSSQSLSYHLRWKLRKWIQDLELSKNLKCLHAGDKEVISSFYHHPYMIQSLCFVHPYLCTHQIYKYDRHKKQQQLQIEDTSMLEVPSTFVKMLKTSNKLLVSQSNHLHTLFLPLHKYLPYFQEHNENTSDWSFPASPWRHSQVEMCFWCPPLLVFEDEINFQLIF